METGTPEMRKEALESLKELNKWGIYPYHKSRISIEKEIKFTYNMKRLRSIHRALENKLNQAIMKKISEGIEVDG
jgi:hypothetical protein